MIEEDAMDFFDSDQDSRENQDSLIEPTESQEPEKATNLESNILLMQEYKELDAKLTTLHSSMTERFDSTIQN